MIILKNFCFETAGINITIPDGYLLDTSGNYIGEDVINIESADGDYNVVYNVDYNFSGTKESLTEMQQETFHKVQLIEEIETNGLKGHKSTYGNEKNQYFEARFLIDESDEGTTELSIVIETSNNDIEKIKASPEFKELLDGIQRA